MASEFQNVSFFEPESGERFDVLINPETLPEEYSTNWTEHTPHGSKNPIFQYTGHPSKKLNGIEFKILKMDSKTDVMAFRDFILSIMNEGDHPRTVLFVWPNVRTAECIIDSATFTHELFDFDLSTIYYKAVINMREVSKG